MRWSSHTHGQYRSGSKSIWGKESENKWEIEKEMRGKDRCKDLYSGMGRQRAEVPPKSRLGHQTGRRTQGRVTGSAVEATRQAGRGRRSRAVARAHLALVAVDLVAASHGGRRAPLGLDHRSTGLRLLLLRQDLSTGGQSRAAP